MKEIIEEQRMATPQEIEAIEREMQQAPRVRTAVNPERSYAG